MWRQIRSDPVRRLRERLDGFGATMDSRRVLEAGAIQDATAVFDLVEGAGDSGSVSEQEAEAIFLLACLHWYRYQVLPPGEDATDLTQAVVLTQLLLNLAPQRVPPSLLAMLRAHVPASAGPTGGERARPGSRVPVARSAAGTADPRRSADTAAALFFQAVTLMGDAERSGDYRVADHAQTLLERALAGTPSGVPERLHYLSALGRVHRDQYLHLGRTRSLSAAIDAHRESLESTPPGDPERSTRLFNLGNVLGDRFDSAGDASALEESIRLLGEATRITPVASPVWLMARVNLGQRLRERWRRRTDPVDLDRAVELLAEAVSAGATPQVTAVYASLAGERFLVGGAEGDLDTAIDANRAALAAGLSGDLAGLARSTLAGLVGERYERRGDPADLDAAIEAYRAAAAGPRFDGHDPTGLGQAAGKLLASRYLRDRRGEDLQEALRMLRAGVVGAADPPERAEFLVDLGYVLGSWYADLTGLAALREARDVLTEAERLLPAEHPVRPDLLNNLGNVLRELADVAGEPELLEPAVAVLRRAVAPTVDPAKLPLYLSNLGLALQALFARTQDLATLTEAITVLRRAVAATPPGHPDRLPGLTNLGSALNRRAELAADGALPTGSPQAARSAAVADAEEAVVLLREAAELAQRETEADDHLRVVGTLASAHVLRYRLVGAADAIEEAISLLRRLPDTMPAASPERHRLLTNLGSTLLLRFGASRSDRDAEESLAAYRAAVAALPADHPDRTMCLSNLAAAIEEIGRPPGSTAADTAGLSAGELAAAIAALREAAAIEAAPSLLRASAARRYAALAAESGDLTVALDGYTTAIELIDLFAWHGMDPGDQGRLLGQFPGLAGDAAAVAIALDRPERAVELLEYGRGVLLARAHDAGADLAALREQAPRLADRLAGLQAALDGLDPSALSSRTAGTPTALSVGVAHGPEGRHELATRRRELLGEIHRLPGFAGFLRPPPFAELARAAAGGPVVLVNVAARRCDALVVTEDGVELVPLPELTLAELQLRLAYFLVGIAEVTSSAGGAGAEAQRRRATFRGRITETLDWLWRVVAAPVLDALGPIAAPTADDSELPRVWWCPTGQLALLPLHAAVPSGADGGVPDRVVSSYTASLRALSRARQGVPRERVPVASALFVGMPQTPGLADLPGAAREEAIIRERLALVKSLSGPAATPAAVLGALPEAPVAHLCCHGTQDLAAPAHGRLALAGGALHVRDLWRPAGATAALAVLSACDTVRGGAALPDEALALGTAFQLAGFRHVVGALWSISDTMTVQVCEDLYAGMAVPGGIDPESAAPALHHAVQQLRAALPGLPELWASYAHIGP
ncbi:CHAT domain-containing protein [Micromonospora phaseoli]|uniref:CHAT domain-containing protein n=2 Tax=Micromonospora phaseoli TaxID=1144548 RepID=A0A1H7DA17_9ACTN|nr:CHAT domain-containing protein [Micromonospora phaseoli]SEJ98568.1 CHAT domain-containing protein [Micromonospora phaseoli]